VFKIAWFRDSSFFYFFHEKNPRPFTSDSNADHEHEAVWLGHDNGSALSLTRTPDFAMVRNPEASFRLSALNGLRPDKLRPFHTR